MASLIAQNTKNIIKAKGLKQSAVAAFAGYSEKTFSNMLMVGKSSQTAMLKQSPMPLR